MELFTLPFEKVLTRLFVISSKASGGVPSGKETGHGYEEFLETDD
jgi:hypothetical protein